MRVSKWVKVEDELPPRGIVVETKIDEGYGVPRNVQELKMHKTGRLWWFPDNSMYIYYTPTHWRQIDTDNQRASTNGQKEGEKDAH